MDDLDPSKADSVGDLAACLMRVRLCAGEPAYRALERQTLHASGLLLGTRLERVRLTRSTLSDVLRGRKFPSKAFLLTFTIWASTWPWPASEPKDDKACSTRT